MKNHRYTKHCAILFISCLMISCSTPDVANVTTENVSAAGEFLFEGPNTLQGPSTIRLEDLATEAGTKPDKIKAIYLSGVTVSFNPDSLRGAVESVLIQWVSKELPLISVATKSPLPATGPIDMEGNSEQDILEYLSDPSSTVVVDLNLLGDADELEAIVTFNLKITY